MKMDMANDRDGIGGKAGMIEELRRVVLKLSDLAMRIGVDRRVGEIRYG